MDAAVSGDLMRQRVGIDTLQLVQLAILDNQTRKFVRLGQLFEDRLARRYSPRRSLATRDNVQLFKALGDLLWRVDVEFATRQLANPIGELCQFSAKMAR